MFDLLDDPDVDAGVAAMRAAEAAASAAAVRQWDAALAVFQSTPRDYRTGSRPQAQAEIALGLGLSPMAVDQRLLMAEALLTHPLLRTLLLGGRLGVPHALVAVDEIAALGDDGLAGRVLAAVLAADGRLGWDSTPTRLRSALQLMAVLLDPEGAARRRQERRAAEVRVRLRARTDGIADWTATGPAEQLTAADRLLDLLATPTGPDDQRSHGQRQVDALVGALIAQAGVAVPVELQLEIPVRIAVGGVVAQTDPARTAVPEPLVVVADLSPELIDRLTGTPTPPTGNRPDGSGPDVNEPETDASEPDHRDHDDRQPDDRDPDGSEPDHRDHADREPDSDPDDSDHDGSDHDGSDHDGSDHDGRDHDGRDHDGRDHDGRDHDGRDHDAPDAPGAARAAAPAPTCARRHRPHGGVPAIVGHGPIDPALLGQLLTDPAGLPVGLSGVRIRRVLVDRTGQVAATDPKPLPLGQLLAGPTGLLGRLLTDLPDPPPRTDAYQPTAAQVRVVRARDRCCTFPGCPRRALHADLDHRVRYPDGPTSTANLQVLCRHHHRLKHDGWQCLRHFDGSTTWTSPRGQVRRTPRP